MQVVAIVSMDANHRSAIEDSLKKYHYSSLLVPDAGLLTPVYFVGRDARGDKHQPSPWRVEDCTLAIVDLTISDDLQAKPAWEDALESVADLPTLYLDEAPPTDRQDQHAWQKRLLAKLAHLHAEQQLGPANKTGENIWLVLASTGGPEAFRAIVDHLPLRAPIGFLYGQHINEGFDANLVSMLDGRRGFSATLGSTGRRLSEGDIVVAPTAEQISLVDNDVILTIPEPWPGDFQPSLNSLAINFGRQTARLGGIIVLSGMGKDGIAAVRHFANQGGRVWVQEPSSCVVESMPEAAIASGPVDFCGTPEEIAARLARCYGDARAAHS